MYIRSAVNNYMVLGPTGNVGIGTKTPGYKLQVQGTGYYSGQLTVDGFANDSGISFRTGISITNVGIRAKAVGTTNRDGLELLGYNGIDFTVNSGLNVAMRIVGVTGSGMGNVGIGTTTPDYKFEVQGVISSADSGLQKATFANVGNDLVLTANADATNVTAKMLFKSSGTGGGAVSEKMRIDSSGNVAIGGSTTPGVSYTSLLQLEKGNSTSNEPDIVLKINNLSSATTSGTGGSRILFEADETGSGNGDGALRHSIESMYFGSVSNWKIRSGNDFDQLCFDTGGSERMRITSGGEVMIRRTTDYGGSGIYCLQVGDGSVDNHTPIVCTVATTSTRNQIVFSNNASNNVGQISTGGSSTSYNTSSDYRLKEDLQDFAGLDMVSKIPVYDFKWKTDESRSYGVIAHQLEEVLPQAVNGEKDAEEMQSVDYSKIVPLLVKSIQELKAEIEILKNK
jgi:hypothetical protein